MGQVKPGRRNSSRSCGVREAASLSAPTSHDNLLPNEGWIMCRLPAGCTSEIKRQKGGEGRVKVFTQESKKEKTLASSGVIHFLFIL